MGQVSPKANILNRSFHAPVNLMSLNLHLLKIAALWGKKHSLNFHLLLSRGNASQMLDNVITVNNASMAGQQKAEEYFSTMAHSQHGRGKVKYAKNVKERRVHFEHASVLNLIWCSQWIGSWSARVYLVSSMHSRCYTQDELIFLSLTADDAPGKCW